MAATHRAFSASAPRWPRSAATASRRGRGATSPKLPPASSSRPLPPPLPRPPRPGAPRCSPPCADRPAASKPAAKPRASARLGQGEQALHLAEAADREMAELPHRAAEPLDERLRHDDRAVELAAEMLDAAGQVHVGADHGEVEPLADPDIAVGNRAVMQCSAAV